MPLHSPITIIFIFIISILVVIPTILSQKNEFVMVGTYVPIPCTYNKSLKGNVFYMFLSWDADNALAYLFNGRLTLNKETNVYKLAKANNFNVERVSGQNKIMLIIQLVSLKYKDLKVTCLVKDDDGRGAVVWKQTTKLTVIDPPRILRFAKDVINVTRGDTRRVELVCVATGYPPPVVKWRKRSTNELVRGQTFDPKTLTARCLLPTPFSASEDGNFLCEATTNNTYMEAIGLNTMFRAVRVNVQYPPVIHVKDQVIYTDIGRRVSVQITVAGSPQPTLRCSFFAIRAPKFFRVRGHPSPHRFTYEMTLPRVRPAQVADYRCEARNRLGADWAMVRLRYGPSKPLILSPGNTPYSNYYGLKWSVLSAARLYNLTVELSTKNETGAVTSVRSTVVPLPQRRRIYTNQTFLYHVTNLSSGTSYAVRVRTCNRYHCSLYSRQRSFRTSRFDGTNTVNPSVLRPPPTTHRPSNIRLSQRCSAYGFGSSVCGAEERRSSSSCILIGVLAVWWYY